MNKNLAVIALTLALAFSSTASANLISTDVILAESGLPGSVQQIGFSVTTAGDFDIDALGFESLGPGYNTDPQMYLFRDDGFLDVADLLAENDDADIFTFESHIDILLDVGNYILAVSEWFFFVEQAVSGIEDSVFEPGTSIRATISSEEGVARFGRIPVPASPALLLAGLVAWRLSTGKRRRSGFASLPR